MGQNKRAPWHVIYLSYPCPTCGVGPGEDCVAANSGKKTRLPHADRSRWANRCPRCGTVIDADDEPGQLCPRCELIRALEVERATKYKRRD